MEINREFCPGNRYEFDFKLCKPANGWAQIDTDQDAWYFGQWCNPFQFEIASYAEGDCTHIQCEDESEFKNQIQKIVDFGGFKGIDPMCNDRLEKRFIEFGLNIYFHRCDQQEEP